MIINISLCVGLNGWNSENSDVKVYPNPGSENMIIELNNSNYKYVEVMDISGRVVIKASSSDEKININICDLTSGTYYVKVSSDKAIENVKFIKN